ncbi:hypothetical protein [Actinomyces sp.]|uniref:hypothetical protein n=1 Tax=Actinomyces sp. TaxID=29317 RepID=UPI0026DB2F9F|nr:hypothetical protein [Actinomyces sp.]MDO4899138.1 hypothetical protein [Actinomyces sp.]
MGPYNISSPVIEAGDEQATPAPAPGTEARYELKLDMTARVRSRNTFNVLWPGGELATRRGQGVVMEAAGLLRRLGVDVRIRMSPAEDDGQWADTVLVLDDGGREPKALEADLEAAVSLGEQTVLCTSAPETLATERLCELRTQLRVLSPVDASLLAAAWLALAEHGTRGDGLDDSSVCGTAVGVES